MKRAAICRVPLFGFGPSLPSGSCARLWMHGSNTIFRMDPPIMERSVLKEYAWLGDWLLDPAEDYDYPGTTPDGARRG
jgi:hypothetical protein